MTDQPVTSPPVTATYRLQLHAGFTFADAEQVLPYLAELGVSHLYLSPILAAVPGSQHGYDVEDHTRVNPELGGREGLESLVARAREHGLGVIVDIVPNHMAMTPPAWRNRPLWEVLREGPHASTAAWFDIDWSQGRMGLPILGEEPSEAIAGRALQLDTGTQDEGPAAGRPVLRYHEHVFPVRESSLPDEDGAVGSVGGDVDLADLLEQQHYRLAHWREDTALNYRRFFEVDTLIGVRVEQPEVFDATHALLLELHHDGLIDGFRIDHPDGLADPGGYLQALTERLRPGTPVWVEKILHGAGRHEWLPAGWDCTGTTGYDATAVLLEAATDPDALEVVTRTWAQTGAGTDYAALEHQTKAEAVDSLLSAEMARLTRTAVAALGPDVSSAQVRAALRALLIATDAYRIYLAPGQPPDEEARDRMAGMVQRAQVELPEQADLLAELGRVLVEPATAAGDASAADDLAVRFQQVTGPVMAKGIEDTAFYRWHALVARCEVGADPVAPAGPGVLHDWAQHQARHWPDGMTTLSTHDTKRSEGVRARVLALAGHPEHWERLSEAFAAAADAHEVDRPTAHLMWQTLVGVGSIEAERWHDYLTKAIRESREHTSWVGVNQEYEGAVHRLADAALTDPGLTAPLESALRAAESDMETVALAQKALQLCLPGVPDTYQGCELWELSLVDPDNRRPVDYADRSHRLQRLRQGQQPQDAHDRMLDLTHRLLRLRRDQPELFSGDYRPLDAGLGIVGFTRSAGVAAGMGAGAGTHVGGAGMAGAGADTDTGTSVDVVVLAALTPAAARRSTGHDLTLAAGRYRDVLSDREVEGGSVDVTDLLAGRPACVLVPATEGDRS